MEKKAQFYLIAAIIIVGVIIGLAAITNYVIVKEEPVRFYDLSEELSEESYRTSEYILVNDKDFDKIMEDLILNISKYIKEDVDNFAVLRGNESGATLEFFSKNNTGQISLDLGGTNVRVTGQTNFKPTRKHFSGTSGGGNVTVNLLGKKHNFNLKKGQNFIFIITKEEQGETYVTQTQENVGEETGEN